MYRTVFKEQFLYTRGQKLPRHQEKKSEEVSDMNTDDRERQKMSFTGKEREINGRETNFKRQCLYCPTLIGFSLKV